MSSHAVVVSGRVLNHRPDSVHVVKAARDASTMLARGTAFVAGLALAFIASVLDQFQLGACTGNGAAQNFRAAMRRAGVTNPALVSRLWLYWLGRAFDHDTANDDGAQIGNVFLGAERYGMPPETTWPYDVATFRGPPPPECYRAAFDFMPRAHRINSVGSRLIDDVTAALGQGLLVTFGSAVSEAYCSNAFDASKPLQAPRGADVAGLHCENVADRDPDGSFKICNSWGEDWGGPAGNFRGGFSTFSPDYLLDSNSSDFWVVDLVPRTDVVDPA